MAVVEQEVKQGPTPKQKPKPRKATFDRLRKKKPVTKKLKVYLEDYAQPDQSEFWPPNSLPTTEQRDAYENAMQEWRDRMDEDSVVIILQGIGRREYSRILEEHPATAEQVELAKKRELQAPDYDPETFAPAIIQASIAEPELTLEEVKILFDTWNQGEIMRVFLAAVEVNTGSKVEDFGKGFAPMLY